MELVHSELGKLNKTLAEVHELLQRREEEKRKPVPLAVSIFVILCCIAGIVWIAVLYFEKQDAPTLGRQRTIPV